jgi:hypothetical protein
MVYGSKATQTENRVDMDGSVISDACNTVGSLVVNGNGECTESPSIPSD